MQSNLHSHASIFVDKCIFFFFLVEAFVVKLTIRTLQTLKSTSQVVKFLSFRFCSPPAARACQSSCREKGYPKGVVLVHHVRKVSMDLWHINAFLRFPIFFTFLLNSTLNFSLIIVLWPRTVYFQSLRTKQIK